MRIFQCHRLLTAIVTVVSSMERVFSSSFATSPSGKVVGETLLLRPRLLVVSQCMIHQLGLVCGDELFAAVLALHRPEQRCQQCHAALYLCDSIARSIETSGIRYNHTIDVGLGALTGRPLALTGARVPAFSAALCSRWTYAFTGKLNVSGPHESTETTAHTLAFLEIGMLTVWTRRVRGGNVWWCVAVWLREDFRKISLMLGV